MIVIGIDPGAKGAIAVYNTVENALEVYDMPTVEVLRNGKKKTELNDAVLSRILRGTIPHSPDGIHAVLERVGAMPGQGVSSTFAFGLSVGIIRGILAALQIPVTIVPPQTWQKAMAVRGGKDGSRLRATELFPEHSDHFKLVKHDGRADATLIAKYGATMLQK